MERLDQILKRIMRDKVKRTKSDYELAQMYMPIVSAYADVSFDFDTWMRYESDVHLALESFKACLQCNGSGCKAMSIDAATPAYHGVDRKVSQELGRPYFRVRRCLSWHRRKQACLNLAMAIGWRAA